MAEGSRGLIKPSRGDAILSPDEMAFLLGARRIVLCTIAPDGSPRPVPVCFALAERSGSEPPCLYTPLDEKPKRVADPHMLARVRDIAARPRVTLLADRWDEDWGRLAWMRLSGLASLVEPGTPRPAMEARDSTEHAAAVASLRARYPQYATHDLAVRPIIRILLTGALSWGSLT